MDPVKFFKKNIIDRVAKGKRIIADISNILENASFGQYYFKTALMLRQTMLISAVCFNYDVWYCLSTKELKELSKQNRIFFSSLFKVPFNTSYISFLTETGTIEIELIIKARRVMYLFNLARRPKDQTVYLVFITQFSKRKHSSAWVSQYSVIFKI